MKRFLVVLLIVCLGVSSVFANGTTEQAAAPAEQKSVGPIDVYWWTHWSGSMADPLVKQMEAFNKSQSKYVVHYVYQGTSLDVLAKLQSTQKKDLPAVFTGPVEYTGYYAGCDFVIPIQDFIDKDHWDTPALFKISQASYSNLDGRLVGYPAGNSFPGMFVNLDMFKKAGIDPYTSLDNFQDVFKTVKTIVDKGISKVGIGFHNDAYWIAMTLSTQGVPSFDNNDGFSGKPTKCIYNQGKTKEAVYDLLKALHDIYAGGYGIPYGANINNELIPRFASGEFPVLLVTTGFFAKIKAANPKFEYTLLPLPGCDVNRAHDGVPAGGCGWFICDNGNKAAQQGAYEFAKFMSDIHNNATWAMSTGYLPQTQAAVETTEYQDFIKNVYPSAKMALDVQKKSTGSIRNPFIPIANEHKQANDIMLTQVTTNPNADINKVIDDATARLTDAIQLYNSSSK